MAVNMDSNSISRLVELAKCSMCLRTPEDIIYQCIYGHLVCRLCYIAPNCLACPTCNASYFNVNHNGLPERQQIRNLTAEALLNDVIFDCPNYAYGCRAVGLRRSELKTHVDNCTYKQGVRLCRELGLACDFETSRSGIESAFGHFITTHGFSLFDHPEHMQFHSDFNNIQQLTTPRITQVKDSNGRPVLFIILPSLRDNREYGKLFMLEVIQISDMLPGYNNGFSTKFTVRSPNANICNIHHAANPVNFLNYSNRSQVYAPMYPVSFLRQHYLFEGNNIVIQFKSHTST